MVDLPPGIVYLVGRSPRLLSPAAITYGLIHLLNVYFDIKVPSIVTALALLASLPLVITGTVLWRDYLNQRNAALLGAVLPPTVKDPVPGGLGGVMKGVRSFKIGYPADGFDELVKKAGGYTLIRRIFFEIRVITAEPEHIKAMLATQFDAFEKGPEVRAAFYPLLGTGVFAADGDLWKFHRSMTRPFFSKDRISHFDNFDRHAEDAILQMKNRFRKGHPVDFQDLIARFTLDSATEFLFGNDVKSLAGGLPYPYYVPATSATDASTNHPSSNFVRAFSEAQTITSLRTRFGPHWPLMEFWHNKLTEPMRVVHNFIEPIVAEAMKRKRATIGEADQDRDDETLLEHLVRSTEDPIILRDEIMNLLVAGRDTTASTLTFMIYMLAEHPETLQRLRQEIMDKIGPVRRPTYDDFRNMKLLRAVINETLRLYPVVPFNTKTSKTAALWPPVTPGGKPFYIPPGTRMPFGVFMMHRRTDLWGPDALEFDPDRFLDDRLHKYLTPNPFIFLPFNAGPRICLGQQFAYHEISLFMVRLLQGFSTITLVPEAQPPDSRPPSEWAQDKNSRKRREKIHPKTHLTMYVAGGLWVTMREAPPVEGTV